MSVVAAKKALRASMKKTLDALSPPEISHQSRLATARLMSHPTFQTARVVSCYLSMPSGELDTSDLVRSILKAGKILFVPRIDKVLNEINMYRIYDEEDLDALPAGKWGIREPAPERNGTRRASVFDADTPPFDLIIMPGVAFDSSLSRLGHGKGYYDRFLQSYRSSLADRESIEVSDVKMPLLLALALTQQVVHESIPVVEHDWKMDGVFYPDGLIGPS